MQHNKSGNATAQGVPVQFEGVGTISVCSLLFQILRQVDDHDGIEWAFLQQAKRFIGTPLGCGVRQQRANTMGSPYWTALKDSPATSIARKAHLHTDAAAYAELLGNPCHLAGTSHLYAQLACRPAV